MSSDGAGVSTEDLLNLKLATPAAEKVALRLLAQMPGVLCNNLTLKNAADLEVTELVLGSKVRDEHEEAVLNKLWKEAYKTKSKDVFGADATVLVKKGDKFDVHL